MTETAPPDADAAQARQTALVIAALEAMENTLSVAEGLVAAGRRVDLAGLEEEIGRLCAAALLVPPAATPVLRQRLESLRGALDRLEARLPPRP